MWNETHSVSAEMCLFWRLHDPNENRSWRHIKKNNNNNNKKNSAGAKASCLHGEQAAALVTE